MDLIITYAKDLNFLTDYIGITFGVFSGGILLASFMWLAGFLIQYLFRFFK